MLVLGIDTTTPAGCVGLADSQGILAEEMVYSEETHSERLMPAVDRLLTAVGRKIEDVQGIAVAKGPGSFTGARIGVTTAKTLAQVLKVPLVGLSTLEVLALGVWPHRGFICPVIDARHLRGYYALFRVSGEDQVDPVLIKEWEEDVDAFTGIASRLKVLEEPLILVGNGVFPYRDRWQEMLNKGAIIPPAVFHFPRGGSVACLGRLKLKEGVEDNLWELKPIYLKRPQAEINWEIRHREEKRINNG